MNELPLLSSSPEFKAESGEKSDDKEKKKKKTRRARAADFIKDLFRSASESSRAEHPNTTKRHNRIVESLKNIFSPELRPQSIPVKASETYTHHLTNIRQETDVTYVRHNSETAIPEKRLSVDTHRSENSTENASEAPPLQRLRLRFRGAWHRLTRSDSKQTFPHGTEEKHVGVGSTREESEDEGAPENESAEYGGAYAPSTYIDKPEASRSEQLQNSYEKRVVKEEASPLVALAAISTYVRARSEKRQRRKLEKQIEELSEQVERQRKELDQQRLNMEIQGGQHSTPIERKPLVPGKETSQQLETESQRPFAVANNMPPTHEAIKPPALSPKLPKKEKPRQEFVKDTWQEFEPTREAIYPSPRQENLATGTDIENQFEKNQTVRNIAREALERHKESMHRFKRSYSNPVTSGTAVGRAKEAYQNLKQTAQTYSERSREKVFAPQHKRLYAEASAFTVWTAIIAGWIIFFFLLIWLARSVFGIL